MNNGGGRLNHRVEVKKPVETSGEQDLSVEDNWRIVCRRWCQVVPRGSREFQRQDQIGENITHLLRFRLDQESKKFKTTWKAKEGDKVYNFEGDGINENDANKFLLFPAVEVPVI